MENDWLLLNVDNPLYDTGDFRTLGISTENTLFLSKEDYKNKKFVLNKFTDANGNFDNDKFDKFYDYLANGFSKLDTAEYLLRYDIFDYYRDKNAKEEDFNVEIYRVSNPTGQKIGAAGINKISESPFSSREWAEKQKVVNSETGEEMDYSPNDHTLTGNFKEWFLDLFRDPLVLAVYDEDGEHEDLITHEIVKHKKGDYKLNKEGKPYWETLGGRSIHGKQVLSSSDVFTIDGEGLNDYDCFDSDDIEKSIAGVIAKTAWAIVPLFTPIAPYYAGILAAREFAKAAPMLEGIFGALTGNNDDTSFTPIANSIAGKATQLSGTQSDYAQLHAISFEGLANLLSDVALQWGQLKLIGQAYTKLKGLGSASKIEATAIQQAEKTWAKQALKVKAGLEADKARELSLAATKEAKDLIESQFENKLKSMVGTQETWKTSLLGKSLIDANIANLTKTADKLYKAGANTALAHMAIASNTDVYGSMLEHGATKREAALVALASTVGMFTVDKWLGLDKIFFDEISIENRSLLKKAFINEAELMLPEFINIFKDLTLSKALKVKQLFLKGKELGRKATNTFFSDIKDHTASGFKKAIAEGVEEVNEELVSDLSKEIYLLAGELGLDTSTRNVEAFDNWNMSKLLPRYGMNFLGGFLGGSVFYGVEAFNAQNIKDSDHQSLLYALRNVKGNGINTESVLKYLDKLHKSGQLGSTTLSAKPMMNDDGTVYTDSAGRRVYNTAKKGEETVNDFIYNRLREEVMQIDGIIREYNDNLSDEDLFKTLTYNEERFLKLEDYLKGAAYTTKYFEIYQNLLNDYVDTEVKLRNLRAPDLKNNPEYAKYEEEYNRLNEKKALYRQLLDDFKSGRASINFLRMMLMQLDSRVNSAYKQASFNSWLANEKRIKDVNSLNEEEYAFYKKEYLENVKPFLKEDLFQKYLEFIHLEQLILPELMQIQEQMKDFKVWHDKVQKLFEEDSPFSTRVQYGEDSLLPGETKESESYINRKTQLESETPEAFLTRYNLRQQMLLQLLMQEDERIINEALDLIKNAGFIDSATKRHLLSMITTNKNQLISNGLTLFKDKWRGYFESEIKSDFSNLEDIKKEAERKIRNYVYSNSKARSDIRLDALEKYPELVSMLQTIVGEEYNGENREEFKHALTSLDNLTARDVVELQTAIDEDNSGDLNTAFNTIMLANGNSYTLDEAYIEGFDGPEDNIYQGGVQGIELTVLFMLDLFDDDLQFSINEINNNPYYKFLTQVENFPTKSNPIIDIVKKLSLGLNRDYKNTEQLLLTIYERASTGSTSNFRLSEAEQSALDEATDLLQRALGYMYAAKNAPVATNPFLHNVTVNQIAKKHKIENWEDLPVLDLEVSDLYLKEIVDYLREIGVWEGGDWNYGSWRYWNNVSLRNRIEKFINSAKNYTKIKIEWLEANRDKFKGKDFDLLEGIDSITRTSDLVYLHLIEDLFYNNVQKALSKYSDFGEIIENTRIGEVFNEIELQEQATVNLDENITLENLTSTDKAMYLLSIAGISSSDFNAYYGNELDSTNIAPLITLKSADRMAAAMINDLKNGGKIWKSGMLKLHELSNTKALLLTNVMTIFGNGGSGKTVGCIKVIRDYVGGEKEDVWIIAPGSEQLANLKDLNSTLYTIDEAKDKLIKSLDTEEVEVEGNYVVPKVNNVSLNIDKSKLPKCIIIDESTHVDSTTLQALNKIASDNNISIIAVGDDLQNGYENEESGKDNESLHISNVGNSAVIFCGRSSRLGITLRDSNFQKSENNNTLANITSNLLHIPVNVSKVDRDARIKNAIKAFEDFTLQYYYGEIVNGDYITPTLDDLTLSKIPQDAEIAFVGDTNSNSYRALISKFGDKVKSFTPKSIQGREFDYVVVDLNWTLDRDGNSDLQQIQVLDFLLNLYTMITRSREATILIDNGLSNIVKSSEVKYKGNIKNFTPEIITQFKNQEKLFIESLNIKQSPKAKPESNNKPSLEEQVNELIDKMNATTDYDEWKALEMELNKLKKSIDKDITLNKLNPAPEKTTVSSDLDEPKDTTLPIISKIITEQSDTPPGVVLNKPTLSYLAYGSVHYLGVKRNGDTWIMNKNVNEDNVIRDIQIVNIEEEAEIKNGRIKRKLIDRLLGIKSDIIFNKPYSSRLSSYMTKDEYELMKFIIRAIPEEQFNDSFVGLSDLNKDNEKFSSNNSSKKYVFKIVSQWTHNGQTYELSLGSLSNPNTTVNDSAIIVTNAKDRIERLNAKGTGEDEIEKLEQYITAIEDGTYVRDYRNFLEKLESSGEIEVTKESLNLETSRTSLAELDTKETVALYRNKNPHLVISPVCFYRTGQDIEDAKVHQLLRQRAVIFVSPDKSLSPKELPKIWAEELRKGLPHSVLMIRLLNRGVTLHDLNSKKFKELYISEANKGGKVNMFPFETRPMSYRMLVSLWNYRADLINFLELVKSRIEDGGEFSSLDELDAAIYRYSNAVFSNMEGNTLDEAIQKSMTPEFLLIENINNAIKDTRFRLGSRHDAPTIIRKVKDDYYGIFTTYANAQKMLDSLNILFDLLESLVKVTKNGEDVSLKVKLGDENGRISWKIKEKAQFLEYTEDGVTYKFPDNIRFLPLLLLKLYGRAGVYSTDSSKFTWDENTRYFTLMQPNGEESYLDLKDLIEKGKDTQDLLNLCLFGTTDIINEDGSTELLQKERATDAYFKNGLYCDPMSGLSEEVLGNYAGGQFVPVGNSEYCFYTEYTVRMPRINFNPEKVNPINPEPINPEPVNPPETQSIRGKKGPKLLETEINGKTLKDILEEKYPEKKVKIKEIKGSDYRLVIGDNVVGLFDKDNRKIVFVDSTQSEINDFYNDLDAIFNNADDEFIINWMENNPEIVC